MIPRRKVILYAFLLLILPSNGEFLTYVKSSNQNVISRQSLAPRALASSSSDCGGFPESGSISCVHVPRRVRIGAVNPVFTTAAYSSFYIFFRMYRNLTDGKRIQRDTSLLSAVVNLNGWGLSYGLIYFIESGVAKRAGISIGNNIRILTDIDVNDGALFYSNGTRRFDVVIVGFTEYVTASEYSYYKRFVETGGRLILLSACNFVAEVSYDPATNTVRLVKGHGWVFDGKVAQKGPFHRWYEDNSNWVGSNYALFYPEGYQINGALATIEHPLGQMMTEIFENKVLFSSYSPHEENIITNASVKPIAIWQVSRLKHKGWIVAAYEHDYQNGTVIHLGVFGTDIIAANAELQFLVLAAITYPNLNHNSFYLEGAPILSHRSEQVLARQSGPRTTAKSSLKIGFLPMFWQQREAAILRVISPVRVPKRARFLPAGS